MENRMKLICRLRAYQLFNICVFLLLSLFLDSGGKVFTFVSAGCFISIFFIVFFGGLADMHQDKYEKELRRKRRRRYNKLY